jgi:hypothetical protein
MIFDIISQQNIEGTNNKTVTMLDSESGFELTIVTSQSTMPDVLQKKFEIAYDKAKDFFIDGQYVGGQ